MASGGKKPTLAEIKESIEHLDEQIAEHRRMLNVLFKRRQYMVRMYDRRKSYYSREELDWGAAVESAYDQQNRWRKEDLILTYQEAINLAKLRRQWALAQELERDLEYELKQI